MPDPLGIDKDLYTDAKITLSVTPDADLSSANAIRAYLVQSGSRVQWGSDQGGVDVGTEVTASDRPTDLTLGGDPVDAGRYTLQWKYEDSDGNENTIVERPIQLTAPSDE
jgi:hypothetical protein